MTEKNVFLEMAEASGGVEKTIRHHLKRVRTMQEGEQALEELVEYEVDEGFGLVWFTFHQEDVTVRVSRAQAVTRLDIPGDWEGLQAALMALVGLYGEWFKPESEKTETPGVSDNWGLYLLSDGGGKHTLTRPGRFR